MKNNVFSQVQLTHVFNLNEQLKDTNKLHSAWRKEQRSYMSTLNYMWQHAKELMPLYSGLGVEFPTDANTGKVTKKTFQQAITDALGSMHENMYGFISADNGGEFLVKGFWGKKALKDEEGEFILDENGKKTYEPKFRAVTDSWCEATIWNMLMQSASFKLDATLDEVAIGAAA